jgi:hypothetical protein
MIIYASLVACFFVAAKGCTCDDYPVSLNAAFGHQINRRVGRSQFKSAKVKGEGYVRPAAVSTRYSKKHYELFTEESDPTCNSDQIHISLGDTLGSMVVSYASYNLSTDSAVYYALTQDEILSHSNKVRKVVGTSSTYSELTYITGQLVDPTMGEPLEEEEPIIDLQDTKDWAFDPKTGEKFFNWYNVTKLQTGIGRYNNPYMYYDSPMLHTVVIPELTPLTTYYYRVTGSCKVFKFTTPPFYYGSEVPSSIQMYPFSIAMIGDVGQTEVSLKTLQATLDLQPDAVLLVGDLSYAGKKNEYL